MKTYGVLEVQFHEFLPSALVGYGGKTN